MADAIALPPPEFSEGGRLHREDAQFVIHQDTATQTWWLSNVLTDEVVNVVNPPLNEVRLIKHLQTQRDRDAV
jgi:hypothetical protein